jgi:Patatin-like phospholipase
MLGWSQSIFRTTPLKADLIEFFGENRSLFAPAKLSGCSYTTRVAVTVVKDKGATNCLITSYNRPIMNADDNTINSNFEASGVDGLCFEREESEPNDFKIWEAALATSDAPLYLKPFVHTRTATDYVDGALFANCPVDVALQEMNFLWPGDGASLNILLSLSTGLQEEKVISSIMRNTGFDLVVRAFHRNLDTETHWNQVMLRLNRSRKRSRLHRLDPPLNGEYVELYHYQRLLEVEEVTRKWAESEGAKHLLDTIANSLIANLFFFETEDEDFTAQPHIGSLHGKV